MLLTTTSCQTHKIIHISAQKVIFWLIRRLALRPGALYLRIKVSIGSALPEERQESPTGGDIIVKARFAQLMASGQSHVPWANVKIERVLRPKRVQS